MLIFVIFDNFVIAKILQLKKTRPFNKKALTFLYSSLTRRKQTVKINDTESSFQIVLSGITQGSILGPFLLKLFINDFFFFIKEAELAKFSDENLIYVGREDLT